MTLVDPTTAIYTQLWYLLEQSGSLFNAQIPQANRVKINFTYINPASTQQVPVQYTAPEADANFPQASILLAGVSHKGKHQSPRMGDNRGNRDQGRVRVWERTFDLILIHLGFDITTNDTLVQDCINLIEHAPTGLGLLPQTGVDNLSVGEMQGRTEYGSWEGGSTLRSKTTIPIPVTIAWRGPNIPMFNVPGET